MAKFADHMEKITEGVTEGYQKIEDGVVTGCKKIEKGVVEGFTGITDKMSSVMLDEEGNLKTGKVGETVTQGFQKIEDGVVGGYKKIEVGVVEGFGKVSDKFVEKLFAKEGESVEDAKKRLSGEE